MEFSGSFGFHWYRIDFMAEASASLGNEDADTEATARADAPIPLIGLAFKYNFTPRWTASIHGQVFGLDIGEFSGSLVNLTARTEYWFFNHFGAGLALNWFRLDLDVDSDDWHGELEYKYWGPQIYLTARF